MTNDQAPVSVAPAAAVPCASRLPDLTGLDLESLRTLDHPVLSEVIERLVERVLHPEDVLNEHNQSVA